MIRKICVFLLLVSVTSILFSCDTPSTTTPSDDEYGEANTNINTNIKYDSETGALYQDSFESARYIATYGVQDIRTYKSANINTTNVLMVLTPVA